MALSSPSPSTLLKFPKVQSPFGKVMIIFFLFSRRLLGSSASPVLSGSVGHCAANCCVGICALVLFQV